ncbi:hypothetical protein BJ742DRAFT_356266 [Cladochytrium replicatum]|nr:hypothetical protein BJ742DRAFT_356266 [Cladochytrium replicatum]
MTFLETLLHDGDDLLPSKAELLVATAVEDDEIVDENISSPYSPIVSDSDWEEVEHPKTGASSSNVGEKPTSDEEDEILVNKSIKISKAGNKEDKYELDLDLNIPSEEAYFPFLKTLSVDSNVSRLETSTLIRDGCPVILAPISFVEVKQPDAFGISLRSLAWLAILILGITSSYLTLEFQFWNAATEPVVTDPAASATLSAPEASVTSKASCVAIAHPVSQPTIMRRGRPEVAMTPRNPSSTAIIVKGHGRQSIVRVSPGTKHNNTTQSEIAKAAHSRVTALTRLVHTMMTQWIQHIRLTVTDPTIQFARAATHEIAKALEPVVVAAEHAAETVRDAVKTVNVAMWRLYLHSGAKEFGARVVRGAKRVRKITVTKVGEAVGELERIKVGIVASLGYSWAE